MGDLKGGPTRNEPQNAGPLEDAAVSSSGALADWRRLMC